MLIQREVTVGSATAVDRLVLSPQWSVFLVVTD